MDVDSIMAAARGACNRAADLLLSALLVTTGSDIVVDVDLDE